MSVVFFLLADPVAVLRRCGRVLVTGGRLALYTTSPELCGTPAAPEPVARRGNFYGDAELAALAREAGFANAVVANDHGGQLLTSEHVDGGGRPGDGLLGLMVSREQARRLALALPETVEHDHHGRPSFRVAGRMFATQLRDGDRARESRLGIEPVLQVGE